MVDSIYQEASDRLTLARIVDLDQMLQNAVCDQGQLSLELIQQYLHASAGGEMDRFTF